MLFYNFIIHCLDAETVEVSIEIVDIIVIDIKHLKRNNGSKKINRSIKEIIKVRNVT